MERNWNQLIERYLNNEFSAEGKTAFEAELKQNSELQNEFELHKLTKELIQRNSLRTLVKESGKWFHLKKVLLNSGIVLVIAGALVTAIYVATTWKSDSSKSETPELMDQSMLEKLEKQVAFENIDPEYFQFTGKSDVFLSESGVLLSITDESFLLDGNPYSGEAIVQWQEAQKGSDIVKAGLSTTSGNRLLETQGMFSLNAFTPDGKPLDLSDKGIYVQVPVDELREGMKLFQGVKGENGQIDWQNPVELERIPQIKDMSKMDLFPPKYEPKLNELKWFTEKTKRDSLYLSFEEEEIDSSVIVEDENLMMFTPTPKESKKPITSNVEMGGAELISMTVFGKPLKKTNLESNNLTQLQAEYPEDKARWSFSVEYLKNGYANIVATVNLEENWMIGILNESVEPFTIPTRFKLNKTPDFVFAGETRDRSPIVGGIDSETAEKYQIKKFCNEMAIYESNLLVFKQKVKLIEKGEFEISGSFSFQVCRAQSQCLPPYSGKFAVQVSSNIESKSNHIPPSKVLAIWNKNFNNTNLATQDFEDRMKEIHETCNEKIFDVYAKNLNTPLWELDQRVVKLGYPQFQRFADQKVGMIKVDHVHQTNLNAFYEKAIEEIRARGKNELQTALKKERRWDNELQDERKKEVMRKGLRESINLNEEYGFNLRNVYKQLGVTAGFQMHNGGNIVNIDKYVWDATVARQSTLITDPKTGKTAQITYEPLKVEVKKAGQYDKLFIYLFSKEMNSYQRLDFKEGKLDYNLNGDMNYHAAIIGMNEKGYFYHQINELKAEDLGAISLEEISEKEFDKRINSLNEHRIDKPMSMKDELKWLFKEKANYVVKKKRRDNQAFRNTIRPTIYSCERGGSAQAGSIDAIDK